MKKKISRVIWGICLIAIGIIFILNSFKIVNINIFFNGWWTLFIIVPSFIGIIFDKVKSINVFFFVLGLSLLCYSLSIIQFENIFDIILCFIFILLGVKFIFGKTEKIEDVNSNGEQVPTYFSVFGTSKEILEDEKNCKIISLIGHTTIDLSNIKKAQEYNIKVYTILGGCELITNKDDCIISNIFNVLGTFKNKHSKTKKSKKTIYLNGLTLFGGVNIKTK